MEAAFGYWVAAKLSLGLSQIIGSVWVAVLLYRDGLSDRAFWALVGVASATTISMLYLDFGIGAPGEAKGYASAGASHYFVGFPFSVS